MWQTILFGTMSTEIDMKRRRSGWESEVCEAMNAVGSEQRPHSEVKRKWSDLIVEAKQRISAHQ